MSAAEHLQGAPVAARHRPAGKDEAFREELLGALAPVTGGWSPEATVERSWPEHRGSYRIEIVTVREEGRDPLRVFLKDFGESTHAKDEMANRRRRELVLYRDVFATADFGTPRYLGASWDERRRRFWLLLEFVDGKPIRYCGFDDWLRAATWLGRLRVRLGPLSHSIMSVLVDHDEDFFARVAERALAAVRETYPRHAERLARLVSRYRELIPELVSEPRHLVHGHFRPWNLILRTDGEAPRLCATDWEEAAAGSPLYDLAHFSDGFEPARLNALVDAYETELIEGGVAVPDRTESIRRLRCFQLQRNLKTLTKASGEGFSEKGVEKLIRRSEETLGWLP